MPCDPVALTRGVNRTVTESNSLFGGAFLLSLHFPSRAPPPPSATGSLKAHQVVIIRLLIKDTCLVLQSNQESIFAR